MGYLCGTCSKAHGRKGGAQDKGCFICGGALAPENLRKMAAEAAGLIGKEGVGTFSISTLLPPDWLVKEEAAWDRALEGAQSIKAMLNRELSSAIAKSGGARYVNDGEARLVFDPKFARVSLERMPLFVFGRYRKLVPGLSQSRWICSACSGRGCKRCGGKGKNYESVEERVGEPLKAAFGASGYTMHASGREDVDATNTAGRPFVMQLDAARARKADLGAAAAEIAKSGEVSASGLKLVSRGFVEVVTESHFDKEYEAEVEFEGEIAETEMKKLLALEGAMLKQQTPERVMHRRADLVRERKVIELRLAPEPAKTRDARHATFRIKAEAGTYIKELISGDSGRTVPSFAGVLGFGAKCTKLAVTKIDDGFLETCLGAGGK